MVTTVMREFEGLDVVLPRAKNIEKLESKRHTSYIWSTKDGLVSVDDKLVNMSDLGEVMYVKISRDPKLTVSQKADENSLMETLTDIHSQLKKAQALKLNYSSMSQINN